MKKTDYCHDDCSRRSGFCIYDSRCQLAQQSAEQPAKLQWEQHQHVQLDRQAWPSLEQGV